jgi:hypothetical protein
VDKLSAGFQLSNVVPQTLRIRVFLISLSCLSPRARFAFISALSRSCRGLMAAASTTGLCVW